MLLFILYEKAPFYSLQKGMTWLKTSDNVPFLVIFSTLRINTV